MKRYAAILSCISLISGCGGGGGGGGSSSSAAATPTSVTGVASKGLIKQASVLVCRIVNGSPEPDAGCASGTTGTDGSYSVTMSDGYTGPVMVKVMPAAAGNSMMTDETTGTDVPYTMTMRAVAPSVSTGTMINVTPFSEMAASGASLSMPMDATKISQAITTMQNLMTSLGIDVSVMPMIDLRADGSNPTRLGMEANMVKQLARVAMAAKNSALMTNSSGVACNTLPTVQERFACAVSFMAGVMTSYTGYDQARATAMMSALNAQSPTAVDMPMRLADGSVQLQMTDMTYAMSIQSAMQAAGMATTTAANTANTMMVGMM